MHRTLIHTIRPTHQEISHVDDDTAFHWQSAYPLSIWGENFQAWIGVLQEQREAFVVRVCAESDFFLFVESEERFGVAGGRVTDEPRDPSWVSG
jgi:hypothetical protein